MSAFDNAVEAFKPLLAKRVADFIASTKPDYELQEIANFLTQIVAARQPAIDEPKQLEPPPPPPAASQTITLGADEYTEDDEPKVAPEPIDEQSAPPVEQRESSDTDAWSRVGELIELLPKHSVQPAAPEVEQPEPGEPEVSDFAKKMARGESDGERLAAGGQASEYSRKLIKKRGKHHGAAYSVDPAALGLPVSPASAWQTA